MNVRGFMWKLVYRAHKCPYGLKMANHNVRGLFRRCRIPETLQHVLFNCKNDMEHHTRYAKKKPWPAHPETTIIGFQKVRRENVKIRQGVHKTVHDRDIRGSFQVWKLRCKKLIRKSNVERGGQKLNPEYTKQPV